MICLCSILIVSFTDLAVPWGRWFFSPLYPQQPVHYVALAFGKHLLNKLSHTQIGMTFLHCWGWDYGRIGKVRESCSFPLCIPSVSPTLPTSPTHIQRNLSSWDNFNLVVKPFTKPLVFIFLLDPVIELNSVVVGLVCGKPCGGVGLASVIKKQSSLFLRLYKIISYLG